MPSPDLLSSPQPGPAPGNPFADAVLERIAVPRGASVVDLACGLGRLALRLAAERPDVSVLGVDIAPDVVAYARDQAREHGLPNVRFEVMDLERLALPDASVDVAVSLFGLLQVGDADRSVRELGRVLRPGGTFGSAAYDDLSQHTVHAAAAPVFSAHAAAEALPAYPARDPGESVALLHAAGFTAVDTEIFRCTLTLPTFDAVWQSVASPPLFGRVVATLDDEDVATARAGVRAAVAGFRQAPGDGYAFPMSCRLFRGGR